MAKIPVVVYTTGPSCQACQQTKRIMTREGIVFDEVDLRQHPDLAEQFREQGHIQAPIVVTDSKVWSGFRLDKIRSLANFIFGERK